MIRFILLVLDLATTFSYGDVMISNKSLKGNQTLTASVNVTNTGSKSGKEVVQLYLRDVVGSIARPLKELKGFQKIELKPGKQKQLLSILLLMI